MNKDPRADVVKKALTDPAFKAELLKNPVAAIEKATGVKVPSGVTLKVVEDSASTVHLVLPAAPAKGALTEADLSKVAGGAYVLTQASCSNACTDIPIQCMKFPG